MGVEFYETMMGRHFYEGTMPGMVKSVKELTETVRQLTTEVIDLKKELAEVSRKLDNKE